MPISDSRRIPGIVKRIMALLFVCIAMTAFLASPEALAAAGSFSLSVRRERSYVYINEREMRIAVNLSGGTAPYTVTATFSVEGDTVEAITRTFDQPGSYTIQRMPRRGGDWDILIEAEDAAGTLLTDTVQIRGSVRPRSTEEEYQDGLERLHMTGDWRADLITVAQYQIGDRESPSDYIIGEAGEPVGATRYGVWMDDPYSEWCATFIAYSMMKAEIPLAYDFSFADVGDWVARARSLGAYRRQDYEPAIGDIVFLIPKNTSTIGHIGIVEFATSTTIGTIEGNASDSVARRCYYLDDERIAGYMSMEALMDDARQFYQEDAPVPYQVYDLADRYAYVSANKVNMRAGPSGSGERLFKNLTEGTRVTVTARVIINDTQWYQVEYKDKLGYILAKYMQVDPSADDISECGCYDLGTGGRICSAGCMCLCHGFTMTVEEDEPF